MYKSNGSKVIVGGDMNCVDWPSDINSFVTDKSSDTQRKFNKSLNVRDTWRLMNPCISDFTFIDPNFRSNNRRIDILCVCEQLRPLIQ